MTGQPDVTKISIHRRVALVRQALRRMAPSSTPEESLWLQVILQAVNDFTLPNEVHGPAAPARYFTDPERFDAHAEMAGLDPDAVRELLRVARLIGPNARGMAA